MKQGQQFWTSRSKYHTIHLKHYKLLLNSNRFQIQATPNWNPIGFLRPGLEQKVVNNFGRLDQIVVLHWLHFWSHSWILTRPNSNRFQIQSASNLNLLYLTGFLRPGLEQNVVSNFGLLDQIAALHWLQENVGAFGGNPDAVTLVGHGTGASLVSFLMTSPVAKAGSQGLFQKAILMSGSSLSPMSVCEDPKDITLQVRISD